MKTLTALISISAAITLAAPALASPSKIVLQGGTLVESLDPATNAPYPPTQDAAPSLADPAAPPGSLAPPHDVASPAALSPMGINAAIDVANAALDAVGKIVNLGQKVWAIIVSGSATSDIKNASASAIPTEAKDWTELENAPNPTSFGFRIQPQKSKKPAGQFVLRVNFTPNAQYHGKGHYIVNLTTGIEHLYLTYRENFYLEVIPLEKFTNHGSTEDPIAGMDLKITFGFTGFSQDPESFVIHVRGDGWAGLPADGGVQDVVNTAPEPQSPPPANGSKNGWFPALFPIVP